MNKRLETAKRALSALTAADLAVWDDGDRWALFQVMGALRVPAPAPPLDPETHTRNYCFTAVPHPDKKIQSIRAWREASNDGLAVAKDRVEQILAYADLVLSLTEAQAIRFRKWGFELEPTALPAE